MFGYTAEDIVGKHLDELFTPEDRAAGVPSAVLDRARRSGRHFQERYHRREDGTTFYAAASPRALDRMERWASRRLRTT